MGNNLKRNTIKLVLAMVLLAPPALPAAKVSIDAALSVSEKRQLQREARLVVDLLQNFHYSGRSFREIENREMVARFLAELDPGNDFLTADDMAFMHARFDRTLKTVYLQRGDLQPAFEIFDLFARRALERHAWIGQRLAHGFDFSVAEEYVESHDRLAAKSDLPVERRWELRLKEQVLREILAGREPAAAAAIVARQYDEMERQIATVDYLAVRERFFDSLIRSFDPHSGYFSADSAHEFTVGMENAVAGVGLDFHKENGQCVVTAVQPGGPADLQSDIQPGDIIFSLRDGDGPPVETARRSLRELVALARGQPGTSLHLNYQPYGTTRHEEVTLERVRVLLGAERAHGAVSVVPGPAGTSRRIGWIALPTFYAAGEGATATSATRDIREILEQMMAGGLDGLVIDLRDNPGGAMSEARALSELFIPAGTVVLSRGPDGVTSVLAIKEHKVPYGGPLVVLTSPQSASASEIFAGAMKTHMRAVVVGGAATFGKGTVQNFIELAKAQQGTPVGETTNWGTLRLTAERFYLPDGSTVQGKGVSSDIVLPEESANPAPREADLPHALATESITPPEPVPAPAPAPGEARTTAALLLQLHDRAEADIQTLPEWALWRQEQEARRAARQREKFSLQLSSRRTEFDVNQAEYLARLKTRRELTKQAAFAAEPVEPLLLQPALAAHEAKLRAARGDDGQSIVNRLHRGLFTVETDRGRLRRVRLDGIPYRDYVADAGELAAAYSRATGSAVTADVIARLLPELDLLEHKTDAAVTDCFAAQVAGAAPDLPAVTRGIEAVLRRLTEIDGEMLRERPGLDVPLRECQRLAAAWADWPSPGAVPAATP